MQVRVLLFGMLKDLVGRSDEMVSLPEGATLADLLAHYEDKVPRLKSYLPSVALSVNQEYASPQSPLRDMDEVGLLPPVSGGADETADRKIAAHVAIVRKNIDTQKLLDEIKHPEDGAVAVFEGIVRDHTRGRRTLYLEYEAYEPMALSEMEKLAEQALERFAVREVALVHRLGRLEHTETSVLVIVAAGHRAPAFEACRWLIDTLKQTVPIWKKEYFEDGAIWAEGEPFPAEIPTAARTLGTRPASK
ncbi:MAG TPA: molybdenum cofactor biosynthesis protein MoaE [Terriglobales bacterium]|jgi:molybdopterin synthase catalytic subunit|nr:molybdenum cofactor biosynthesis protein MoaE [Terriglobales bacterium]